jgi:hypothetical protein
MLRIYDSQQRLLERGENNEDEIGFVPLGLQ